MYSQRPVRAGRDSKRVMLTPWFASGVNNACTAPGVLDADSTSEVLSWPDGPASCAAMTKKRVAFCGSSSILAAMIFKPYKAAAVLLAIAAVTASLAARRAASALLTTGDRFASDKWRLSHSWHWARLWLCDNTFFTLLSL